MSNNIALRPIHYASVSGGKDSLYMMKVILENPKKYPLDLVFHIELEIDHEFVPNVIGCIKNMCESFGIPFKSIKPRRTWKELYDKYGLPGRRSRWCNNMYKLDAKKQLHDWIKSLNCRPVCYTGFCADEVKRFKYSVGSWNPEEDQDVCYPLAEEGIKESFVLQWARTQSVFSGWYEVFDRQGCWLCPNTTMLQLAYLQKHSPDKYERFMEMAEKYERDYGYFYFSDTIENIRKRVTTKWAAELYKREHNLFTCIASKAIY